MTYRDLWIAAVLGAASGQIMHALLDLVGRFARSRRRDCQGCRGRRVIPYLMSDGVSSPIQIAIPCPICNARGKFPKVGP